jgi:hypothetical protein
MAESGLPALRENASYPPVSRRFPNGRNPPIPEVQMLWRMPYLATKLKTRTHDARQGPISASAAGFRHALEGLNSLRRHGSPQK